MAALDSSDGQAPEKFQISSSTESAGSQLSIYLLKCSLCSKSKKRFYCKNCIQNGDFIHSTHNFSERFSEKQLKYLSLKANLRKCNDGCNQILQNKKLYENLKAELQRKGTRINVLKNLIADIKSRVSSNIKYKDSLVKENIAKSIVHPKYEGKVKDLEDYVMDRIHKNKKLEDQKTELLDKVKNMIRCDINRLLKFIFPTSQMNVDDFAESIANEKNMPRELETLELQSKDILQEKYDETYHIIVAPYLPANGDYSAYIDWVNHNKDGVPNSTANEALPSVNPAYRISAALTYATQLINLLSFYLDIRLPFKLAYSDFCKQELNEQNFMKKVARLNLNILYLCYNQGVSLGTINPNHTLENILKLIDTTSSDLGRIGPVDASNIPFNTSIDSFVLQELDLSNEYESDDDQSFRQEWEAVSHLPPSEIVTPVVTAHPQQTASMAGGLVTSAAASIASIWRGWTTGR